MSDTAYTLIFRRAAEDQLKALDKSIALQIARKIAWLAENAPTIRHEQLTGDLSGWYRYRAGNYRILYILDNEKRIVEIIGVGHRRDVYKG